MDTTNKFYMNDDRYASNAKGNAGVILGTIGTVLGAVASAGGLTAIFGGRNGGTGSQQGCGGCQSSCSPCCQPMCRETAELLIENSSLKSQMATNEKLAAQTAWNAVQQGRIDGMQREIDRLYGMTKLVIPNASVVPGWGDVTVTPAAAPAAA